MYLSIQNELPQRARTKTQINVFPNVIVQLPVHLTFYKLNKIEREVIKHHAKKVNLGQNVRSAKATNSSDKRMLVKLYLIKHTSTFQPFQFNQ